MKKTIILFVILLIGAGATAGALTSASLGWTFKSVDGLAVFTLAEEEYQLGGILLEVSDEPLVWVDPDEITTILGNVSFEMPMPIMDDIKLSVDAASYTVGTSVTIILENRGSRTAYFKGSQTIWAIDQYKDNSWKKIYPDIELTGIFETQIDPGETKVYTWDQMTMEGQVETGDYRVSVNYYLDEDKYEFIEYVYFSISNFIGTIQIDPFSNTILEVPGYPIIWNEDEDIAIPLPPMQTIPFDDIFPSIPIEKVLMGEYFDATDSITIYNIADSIKIYDPNGGYWWFPIFPYLPND